ncbi:hypothetical protein NLG97_g1567 [Lecanicillium saksenae]|uniref:Uncharacterized protein n=1 Tax=Lecanicillium saksenae TaxID=468837 RepID=A0ACC1R5A5_9HYPO|nr:hypothetical protein NLG97_g1567 [Lecanicillium saksenae]
MAATVSRNSRPADSVLEKASKDASTDATTENIYRPLNEAPITLAGDSAAAERRLIWKLDLIIFPIFFILYMMSFLDRINISNAKIQGMAEELNLTGHRFNVALFIYFVSYILFQVPSNMLIKKARPSLYISGLVLSWGLINMCMGFVQSYGTLVLLRFLLGVFEAGVLPAMLYVSSMYYKRHEYQLRVSCMFSSTAVAGAFGGLIAYGISKVDSVKSTWRYIFIIEGAATAFLGVVAAFVIIDWPEQTRWLNKEEKNVLRRRLIADVDEVCRMDRLDRPAVRRILTDYKIWLSGLIYLAIGVPGYSGAFFLPTILKEFHWSTSEAQLRTVPVYVFAAGCMIIGAWASDKLKHRSGFIVGGTCLSTIGFVMLLSQDGKSREYKFAAVFPLLGGAFMTVPMALGWLQNNLAGTWKKSIGTAMQVMGGNLAGIIGSNVFLTSESPKFHTGYGACLAFMWLGALSAVLLAVLLSRENRLRTEGRRDYLLKLPENEKDNLGDAHPTFRFTL